MGRYLFLTLLMIGLFFCSGTAVCAKDAPVRKTITVVHTFGQAPHSFIGPNGEPQGMVVDYWRKWEKVTGVGVNLVLVDWKESIRMVREGLADVHAALFYTDERTKFLDFSTPLFTARGAIFAQTQLQLKKIEEIRDKPVGVLSFGYSQEFLSTSLPWMNLVRFPTVGTMIQAAIDKQIQVFQADYDAAMYKLGEYGRANEYQPITVLFEQNVHAAVRKGNLEMIELVNSGAQKITTEDMEEIRAKWIHFKRKNNCSEIVAWVAMIAILGLILSGLYLIYCRKELSRSAQEMVELRNNQEQMVRQLKHAHREIERIAGKNEYISADAHHLAPKSAVEMYLVQQWWTARMEDSFISLILLSARGGGKNGLEGTLWEAAEATLKNVKRPRDYVGSFSEDTLALVLPDTNKYGAMRVVDKIKKSLESSGASQEEVEHMYFGVAVAAPAPGQDEELLLDAAQDALEEALETDTKWVLNRLDE
ncbi:MAG: transporter substrate-binding domain-containing protein [Desulfovibrio sp.]